MTTWIMDSWHIDCTSTNRTVGLLSTSGLRDIEAGRLVENYVVRQPLSVIVQSHDGKWTATCAWEWGEGKSEVEAIHDLLTSFTDYSDLLAKKCWGEMSDTMREEAIWLHTMFGRRG